jgi:hypothetical protein
MFSPFLELLDLAPIFQDGRKNRVAHGIRMLGQLQCHPRMYQHVAVSSRRATNSSALTVTP